MELRKEEIKGKYERSEQFYIHQNDIKEKYAIKGINENYWNDFETNSGKTESSLKQYKSAVGRFIKTIDKDVLLININDLEAYLSNFDGVTKENQSRYIKSFIVYSIEKNINKATLNSDKELILNLIPVEYRMLISVLMNK